MDKTTIKADERRGPDFKIFSGPMEAFRVKDASGIERKRIKCVASSSVKDLHGDTMTEGCVRGMATQAKGSDMTIFLNHSYRVPEDVFGTVKGSDVQMNGTVAELVLEIEIDESNPRSVQTHASLENGTKLGVSIGANIEEYEEDPEEKGNWWGGWIIQQVNLLEASIVGIPANPRSWVEQTHKTLKSLTGKGEDDEVVASLPTPDGREVVMTVKKGDGDATAPLIGAVKELPAATPETEPEPVATKPSGDEDPFRADGPEEIVAHYQMQVEAKAMSATDLDAMTDAIQHSIDYSVENGIEKSAFEDRSAADLAKEVFAAIPSEEDKDGVVTPAPEGDQEAQKTSDPESDDTGADEAEKKAAAELEALKSSGILAGYTEAVNALGETLTLYFAEKAAREQLEAANGELVTKLDEATANVEVALQLVKRVMELPIGRKSVFLREADAGLEKLKSGPYGEDVLRILNPEGEPPE